MHHKHQRNFAKGTHQLSCTPRKTFDIFSCDSIFDMSKWLNLQKMVKIAKNGQSGLKWSKMVQHGLKLFKMVKFVENGKKW